MKFVKYNIADELKRNLEELGFVKPTDIQYKVIPSIMNGEDVLAIAQTGTGKTAAFAIPLIDKIHRSKRSSRSEGGIRVLIMVPTRELAQQLGKVFAQLAKHTKVSTFALFGGVEQEQQVAKIEKGLDILITTPGRMFDLANQDKISIRALEVLVLDEADHMLGLGFIEDLKYVKKLIKQKHQTLFFSATLDDEIKKLANSQVKGDAVRIQISPKDPVNRNINHFAVMVPMDEKRHLLSQFIKENDESKILVFVRTRVRAERVVAAMARADISASVIHGAKDQKERLATMTQFRNGEIKILVATDVSARGIDVSGVAYVINYDIPEKAENYVHRIGRTGRGTAKGEALSFCAEEELPLLKAVEEYIGKEIPLQKLTKNEKRLLMEAPTQETKSWQDLIDKDNGQTLKKRKKKK